MSFHDCDQLSEIMRAGDGEFVQISTGCEGGSMTRIDLDGLSIYLADLAGETLFHGVSRPGFHIISLPLRWSGSMRRNGDELTQPTALAWGEPCEIHRLGTHVAVATLAFDSSSFGLRLAQWSGRSPEAWSRLQGVMFSDSPAIRELLEFVKGIVELAARNPSAFDHSGFRKQTSDQVTSLVFQSAHHSGIYAAQPVGSSINRSRLISTTVELLREREGLPLTLLDLCESTGASARSINYAFRQVLGTTPVQYLKLRRLRTVRRLLREANREYSNVSLCAQLAGFSHLGRFSKDYRELFGETPSDTLFRAS